MLKGISKNLNENYYQKLNFKRKDQLKTKEDVSISEAFELYMLKNFFKIELNTLSNKILNFWQKELDSALNNHISFLTKNLENQENYNSKFSKILQEMDIFQSENNEENQEDQSSNEQENSSNNSENQQDKDQERKEQQENQNGLDGEYEFDEHKIDEKLVDTDSEEESKEQVVQRNNSNISGEVGITNLKTGITKISGGNRKKRVKGKFLPSKN